MLNRALLPGDSSQGAEYLAYIDTPRTGMVALTTGGAQPEVLVAIFET
jgi:hypothetical protein